MKLKSQSIIWAFLTWILGIWGGASSAGTYCSCYYRTATIKGWTEVYVDDQNNYDCTLLNTGGATSTFFSSSGFSTSGGCGYASCGYSYNMSYVDRVGCTAGGAMVGRPSGSSDNSNPQITVNIAAGGI